MRRAITKVRKISGDGSVMPTSDHCLPYTVYRRQWSDAHVGCTLRAYLCSNACYHSLFIAGSTFSRVLRMHGVFVRPWLVLHEVRQLSVNSTEKQCSRALTERSGTESDCRTHHNNSELSAYECTIKMNEYVHESVWGLHSQGSPLPASPL